MSSLKIKSDKLRQIASYLLLVLPLSTFCGQAFPDIIVSAISILFVINLIVVRDFHLFKSVESKLLMALYLVVVLSSTQALYFEKSFLSSLVYIRYIFLPLAVCWILEKENMNDKIYKAICYTVYLVLAYGLLQYFADLNKYIGNDSIHNYMRLRNFANKLNLGICFVYLCFPTVFFAFNKIRSSGRIQQKLLWAAYVLACFVLVAISGERTAMLAFVTLMGIAILITKSMRKYLLGIVLLFGVGCFMLAQFSPAFVERQKSIISEIAKGGESIYFKVYYSSVKMALDHPLLGVGTKMYRYNCEQYVQECAMHPHNIYLEYLSESGFLALGLFLGLIVTLFKRIYENKSAFYASPFLLGAVFGILARLFPIASSGSNHAAWSVAAFWLMTGVVMSGLSKLSKQKS